MKRLVMLLVVVMIVMSSTISVSAQVKESKVSKSVAHPVVDTSALTPFKHNGKTYYQRNNMPKIEVSLEESPYYQYLETDSLIDDNSSVSEVYDDDGNPLSLNYLRGLE